MRQAKSNNAAALKGCTIIKHVHGLKLRCKNVLQPISQGEAIAEE